MGPWGLHGPPGAGFLEQDQGLRRSPGVGRAGLEAEASGLLSPGWVRLRTSCRAVRLHETKEKFRNHRSHWGWGITVFVCVMSVCVWVVCVDMYVLCSVRMCCVGL